MDIILNGEQQSVSDGLTAAGLVQSLSLGDSRYAVEINREIILRSELSRHVLNNGDQIEIVQAIGGG